MDKSNNFAKPKRSAKAYILESLIPYTEANIKLIISPNQFFNELQKIDRQQKWAKDRAQHSKIKIYNRNYLKTAYYRLKRQGFIHIDSFGGISLSTKGFKHAKRLNVAKFNNDIILVVIFDIPEKERRKRRMFRNILKMLHFNKLQLSVWTSNYNYQEILIEEIKELNIKEYVRVFKSTKVL